VPAVIGTSNLLFAEELTAKSSCFASLSMTVPLVAVEIRAVKLINHLEQEHPHYTLASWAAVDSVKTWPDDVRVSRLSRSVDGTHAVGEAWSIGRM